jgi:hypothetical protein
MAITDAQYATWLKSDAKHRALLIEAKAYSGGAEVTRYFSAHAFVSEPADTPANMPYDDIVVEVPYFTADLAEAFSGRSNSAWGDIVILNENGARDAWLDDAWDGRAVAIYLGDVDWPKSDFRAILTGVAADLVAFDRNRLALRFRDKSWMLDVPLQTSLIGGTTANAGQPKPVCYGQCFNVEPVLVTAATHEYQVHDGAIEDVTDVRDNGVTVAYTKDLANGKFTLNAAPAGRITCDPKGAKPGGTYLTKCADIVSNILTTRTALAAADIDATSFSDFNTLCPQTLNFYARDTIGVAAVIDQLVTSVGGYWLFNSAGDMVLERLDAPSGTAASDLTIDDVEQKGLRIKHRVLPVKTYRLGYKRNWTPQASSLAGAVTEANRAAYAAEYLSVSATNAGVETAHLLAPSPDMVGTLLVDATEAQTECTRRATLWSTLRYVYEMSGFAAPFQVRLGQVVQLTHTRFGFSAGKLARAIGLRWSLSNNRAKLTLFA